MIFQHMQSFEANGQNDFCKRFLNCKGNQQSRCRIVPISFKELYGNEYAVWFVNLDERPHGGNGRIWKNELAGNFTLIRETFLGMQNRLNYAYDIETYKGKILVFNVLPLNSKKKKYSFIGLFKDCGAIFDGKFFKGKVFELISKDFSIDI